MLRLRPYFMPVCPWESILHITLTGDIQLGYWSVEMRTGFQKLLCIALTIIELFPKSKDSGLKVSDFFFAVFFAISSQILVDYELLSGRLHCAAGLSTGTMEAVSFQMHVDLIDDAILQRHYWCVQTAYTHSMMKVAMLCCQSKLTSRIV